MTSLPFHSPVRRTSSTRPPTPDATDMSSSPIKSQNSTSSKPKRKPTVTPRTFTRFFTPRSFTGKVRKAGVSRRALKELTAAASNRKFTPDEQLGKDAPDLLGNDDIGFADIQTSSKKRGLFSPDTSPEAIRPIKRQRDQSTATDEELAIQQDDLASRDAIMEGEDEESDTEVVNLPTPIARSKYRTQLGGVFRRELSTLSTRLARVHYGNYWQSATANFYSGPEDKHTCYNITASVERFALPFCVTGCKTNSLVAIGDEQGGVRLQETLAEDKAGFSKTYLSFRPHTNAIMDLEFSQDDKLLATAAGDQTSNIVDMPSQQTIHTLSMHRSTVKQVLFQPGSSNSVLATSSRDGTVQIWDLRCAGLKFPVRQVKAAENSASSTHNGARPQVVNWAKPVNTIANGHGGRGLFLNEEITSTPDTPSRSETHSRSGDVSVTSISFLDASRSHLLMTASEANASVKLWDLRTTHTTRRGRPVPLSTTRRPESHDKYRQFGLTSMVLSGDGSRLYTLCRDNTIYAYSTSHLVLGYAPELISGGAKSKKKFLEKDGLGPLYGFRHPLFRASTFYVKLALRPAYSDKPELLAVGSSDACAVVFPTDERYLSRQNPCMPEPPFSATPTIRRPLTRTVSASTRLYDTIPIHQNGTALIRGHEKEVTGLAWSTNGDLVTIGDDLNARCWRDSNGGEARQLRVGGEKDGQRWNCGWAHIDEETGWDDDE